jgi:hypothetical protein
MMFIKFRFSPRQTFGLLYEEWYPFPGPKDGPCSEFPKLLATFHDKSQLKNEFCLQPNKYKTETHEKVLRVG